MHQNLYRIMANHKNSNELETEREFSNGDKRVDIQFLEGDSTGSAISAILVSFILLNLSYFITPYILVQRVQSL